MGGRSNIAGGVVEDEVFEMDEFALDPPRADRRMGNTLV
jgi:hypothetical protein